MAESKPQGIVLETERLLRALYQLLAQAHCGRRTLPDTALLRNSFYPEQAVKLGDLCIYPTNNAAEIAIQEALQRLRYREITLRGVERLAQVRDLWHQST